MDQSEAIREVVGQRAVDGAGEDIGRVVDVFVDEATDAPKWVALQVEGHESHVLAPIGGADLEARPFKLGVDRAHVLSAPTLSSGEERLSPEEEAEIERHYRDPVSGSDQSSGVAESRGFDQERAIVTDQSSLDPDRPLGAGSDAPVEVVRSEEEFLVDTRVVGSERIRLIKRIVTEQVTRTVDVRHEELVVERERLDGVAPEFVPGGGTTGADPVQAEAPGAPGTRREKLADQVKERLASLPAVPFGKGASGSGAFSGETTEITLMQEEIVLRKRVVPRERIRVRKEVVTEQRQVTDTVRKEQVEIEEGARDRGTPGQTDLDPDLGRDRPRPLEER